MNLRDNNTMVVLSTGDLCTLIDLVRHINPYDTAPSAWQSDTLYVWFGADVEGASRLIKELARLDCRVLHLGGPGLMADPLLVDFAPFELLTSPLSEVVLHLSETADRCFGFRSALAGSRRFTVRTNPADSNRYDHLARPQSESIVEYVLLALYNGQLPNLAAISAYQRAVTNVIWPTGNVGGGQIASLSLPLVLSRLLRALHALTSPSGRPLELRRRRKEGPSLADLPDSVLYHLTGFLPALTPLWWFVDQGAWTKAALTRVQRAVAHADFQCTKLRQTGDFSTNDWARAQQASDWLKPVVESVESLLPRCGAVPVFRCPRGMRISPPGRGASAEKPIPKLRQLHTYRPASATGLALRSLQLPSQSQQLQTNERPIENEDDLRAHELAMAASYDAVSTSDDSDTDTSVDLDSTQLAPQTPERARTARTRRLRTDLGSRAPRKRPQKRRRHQPRRPSRPTRSTVSLPDSFLWEEHSFQWEHTA